MTKHTILFLAANPRGTVDSRLDPQTRRMALDQEASAIQRELKLSGYRHRFEMVTRWAVEPLDLLRELRELKPTVVHFSGHGGRDGLSFQAPDGEARVVSPAVIAEAFRAAGGSVKVVVLGACYSEGTAEALLGQVDCVVGMTGALPDGMARAFAIGFYGGLGEQASVGAAYQQGNAAISLQGVEEADRPQLKVQPGVDADQMVLAAFAPEVHEAPPEMQLYSVGNADHRNSPLSLTADPSGAEDSGVGRRGRPVIARSHYPMDNFGRENPFLPSEASIRLFRLLWQLEAWLREMVYVELRARDADWQEQIKKVVGQNWPPRSQAPDKRLTHMATRHESAISYLTLGELIRIIQAPDNWPLFESYFPPRDIFFPRMTEVSQVWHRVAHFRDPHDADVDRVVLFLRDLDQGFWRFVTSYSGDRIWISKDTIEPISDYFNETHDRRWLVEMLTMKGGWQCAADGRQPRLNFSISGSMRPWFRRAAGSLIDRSGFVYHAKFHSLSENRFSIGSILEQTELVHANCMHIRLETRSIDVMIPSVLGKDLVVTTIERFLERCIESVSYGTPLDDQTVERIASEWPEYVIGPSNPLGFLDGDMPCAIFALD